MSDLIDRYLDDNNYRKVEKGGYESSSSDILVSDDLGTCIGIGVYDDKTGKGYLLHVSTLDNEDIDAQLDEFVSEINRELSDPYEILAGGTLDSCYNPLNREKVVEQGRKIAEDALDKLAADACIAWNNAPVFNRIAVSPELGILYDRPEN